MPDSSRGWITNKNWVITTPMEVGIAPPEARDPALDKIRREDVGEYGPFLSAVDEQAMMTISTGVQAVVGGANTAAPTRRCGMSDRIVETFNRSCPARSRR